MNIGVNTRLLLPHFLEGIGRFTHEVMSRMVQNHPNDRFYFFFDRLYDDRYVYGDHVTPVIVSPQSRHPILWYWWFEKSLPKAMEKYDIDVFFSPESYCSLSSQVPVLLYMHDVAYLHFPHHMSYSHRKYLEYFVPKFAEKAESIGCVSQTTKEDLIKHFTLDESKIFVAGNAPTPGYSPMDENAKIVVKQRWTNGMPYFIYLGAIHPRKNISNLILAFNHFRRENPALKYKLLLVGRLAWKYHQIREEYDRSPYKEDIVFTGHIQEPYELLGSAEALVYVSLLEGFGIPLLEAMSCDVPVITSSVSSMPEIAGKAAILVNPEDPVGIGAAMKKMVTDVEVRNKCISEGRRRVAFYSWERTEELIYEQLVKIRKV